MHLDEATTNGFQSGMMVRNAFDSVHRSWSMDRRLTVAHPDSDDAVDGSSPVMAKLLHPPFVHLVVGLRNLTMWKFEWLPRLA